MKGGDAGMLPVIIVTILLVNLLFFAHALVKHRKIKRDFERRRQEMHRRWEDVKENKNEK